MVAALQLLSHDNIVHFDVKGANFLIDPLPGVSDEELWHPIDYYRQEQQQGQQQQRQEAQQQQQQQQQGAAPALPFQAVLADFGQARSTNSLVQRAHSFRLRSVTECFLSCSLAACVNRLFRVVATVVQELQLL